MVEHDADCDCYECIYTEEYKLLKRMFPGANFIISMNIEELDQVLSKKDSIVIKIPYLCYCYKEKPRTTDFIVVRRRGKGITIRNMIEAMVKEDYNPRCAHKFLDLFEKVNDVTFEANFGS